VVLGLFLVGTGVASVVVGGEGREGGVVGVVVEAVVIVISVGTGVASVVVGGEGGEGGVVGVVVVGVVIIISVEVVVVVVVGARVAWDLIHCSTRRVNGTSTEEREEVEEREEEVEEEEEEGLLSLAHCTMSSLVSWVFPCSKSSCPDSEQYTLDS
jgi:hypothetical protein